MPSETLTLLAVHGNGGGAFRFSRLRSPAADGTELVAVTLPGFGGRPLPHRPATLDLLSEALADEIAAIEGPVVVLGHGIGGSIALSALQTRRDGVRGLVLHAPVAARLDSRLFPRLMKPRPVRELVRRGIASPPGRWVGRRLLFRSGDVPRSFVDRFLADYGRADAFSDMFDLLTADWFDSLEPIEVPCIILWGGGDRVLGVDQAAELERVVPGAEQVTVADWGHFPMIEQPDDYLDTVTQLARRLVTP